uniref:Uncharacterized protein n=1 Tax=Pseudocercospora fijiensis TaxID=1873960 RepID=A0A516EZM8_9PEZI|nr:hypothetical protein [Pseudocercospora fijiensis]QDO71958.1 hypothetical protein [Pseudocercospora fijiensis]
MLKKMMCKSLISRSLGVRWFSSKPNKTITQVYFREEHLQDVEAFNKCLSLSGLSLHEVYTAYIKVRYNVDHFFMLGNQIGFSYKGFSSGSELFDIINLRLSSYYSQYNIDIEDIEYFQVKFILLDRKFYKDFMISADVVKDMKRVERQKTKMALSVPDYQSLYKSYAPYFSPQ